MSARVVCDFPPGTVVVVGHDGAFRVDSVGGEVRAEIVRCAFFGAEDGREPLRAVRALAAAELRGRADG